MKKKDYSSPTIRKKDIIYRKKDHELLKAIQEYNSINKAAENLNRSYSSSQKRIVKLEKELGDLIETKRGGIKGGGSKLTENAKKLINRFERLKTEYDYVKEINITTVKGKVKETKTTLCVIDTPIGEIIAALTDKLEKGDLAKILIREDSVIIKKPEKKSKKVITSARNQFEGKIEKIISFEDIIKLNIQINNTIITTTVTKESQQKMNLKENDKVKISFKAMATKTIKA